MGGRGLVTPIQSEPAEGNYDARGDERYKPVRQADIVPTYRAGASYDPREAEPQLDRAVFASGAQL